MLNKFNKILFFVMAILLPTSVFGAAATDNEIWIEQSGNTFVATFDQFGYGNKVGGTLSSGVVATDMIITATSLTMNIDQVGNNNDLFGPIILDTSTIDLKWTGNTNTWDWNIGASSNNADDMDMDVDITSSNSDMDLDIAGSAAANNLNFDLDVTGGDDNDFDVDINSANVTWDWDVIGGNNDFTTNQSDSTGHYMKVSWTGTGGTANFTQSSGSCTGIASCKGYIDLELDSNNANVTIVQKDSGD